MWHIICILIYIKKQQIKIKKTSNRIKVNIQPSDKCIVSDDEAEKKKKELKLTAKMTIRK